jgi:hypothetical protein
MALGITGGIVFEIRLRIASDGYNNNSPMKEKVKNKP